MYVIIFSTITIDGKLASKDYYSELSCKYDKVRQHILRSEVDAIMIGGNTVRIDNPSLTLKYAHGKNPIRVIISNSLNFNINYKIFNTPPQTIIYTSNNSENKDIENKLKEKGVIIRKLDNFNICNVMNDLESNFNVHKVMIEGGGKLIWSVIKENCFDELRVTISPRVFGNGVSLANGEGFLGKNSPKLDLEDVKICECKEEVHLIYKNHSKIRNL
ncbi:2,5-diamino-6-(ribosylamino)-4(3H)-pyrimidinone 5'-phosphate reductase [Acidianus ambivalens]|uniref:2,5-diamino-6-(ribosylamino)-4(3H)-pyrimidinone 5'-phosphate reductase n=1 Tax=Acidianus ambivalens TaxID=2283 RepID=A0A650CXM1_ACIAM|nr:2,5-diamino-6-(ribosylamino)-4(3H)-pyrimidinone 5'-phosphate reductase [Acidianus ambivalens]MQL54755.1 2,5-diamino-6-(ribosylamino)-4(3H)-pyrimidinone 5'-phosphate reductase [Acidianus ambivalens]QGR22548.1 2,5-diamino-6-(ribosylamino)-4(3H)-pyrimidinone 5'-phosphate reductase [Acidianus ambivalens]